MDLEAAKHLVARGKMSRRDFLQMALASGLTIGSAEFLFSSAARAEPKKGGRFRMGLGHGATTDSLDPASYLDYYMGTVGWGTLSNGLTEIDLKGEVQPDLAESFEPSNGAKTWKFNIRKGATFHNGKDVKPADVIASIRHHMGADSKSPVKSLFGQISDITADGNGVLFQLKAGNADFPYILSDNHIPIMPANEDGSADWQSGIRTGPYSLEKFAPGERTLMKRNPNYYRDTWFDEVEVLSIIDMAARQSALMSGEIDYMDRCDLKTLGFLQKVKDIEVDQVTGYAHYVFSMNTTQAPFDNPDVRNAIKYAIDREEIIRKVFGGVGDAGNDNPIAPTIKFASNPQPVHQYDPEMSKSLLKKAGLTELKIELSAADAAFTGAVDAAVLFRESAARAGIDLTVVREANDAYWDNVWLKKPFVASYWLGRPTVDWFLDYAYSENSTQNETFWKNPRFNELLLTARSELDDNKRAAMYAECQQLIHTDGGVINFMFSHFVSAHSKKVGHGDLLSNWDIDGMKIAQRWWFT